MSKCSSRSPAGRKRSPLRRQTSVVETTSSTVSSTVNNAQIAKLPLSGRNILDFALLVPGAAQSTGGRDSHFNGLPGGAINITLDGINNNSQRFRSGGTSMFVFAPVRLGAIEEVTVSTAGLSAEAGAEGAMQIQFVTKRGSNVFRGQLFDQYRSDKLNANNWVNAIRNIPKTKLRQHEYGANVGGPIIKNKLFFFGNFEQVYAPAESTQTRTVLTAEAQQGIFRYNGSDNVEHTVNLLSIAGANGFQSTIDPSIASQLKTVNGSLGGGTIGTSNLFQNTFSFIIPQTPNTNVYPTARIDYQAKPNLAIRGVLNLQWRNLPTTMTFPGMPAVSGGFTSTYYILSTGADWTLRPNLFNQMSFGVQSNFEEFNPGNTLAIYEPQGGRRVQWPLGLSSPEITGDQMPIPRNNPVYNFSSTFTYLRGMHSLTFGGTFRRTTMYESIGGAPYQVNLGVAAGDPVSGIFSASSIPNVRNEDLATIRVVVRVPDRPDQQRERPECPGREYEGVRTQPGVPSRGTERRRPLRAGSVAHSDQSDAELRPAVGAHGRGDESQRGVQQPDAGRLARAVLGAVPAWRPERRPESAGAAPAEAVPR